MAFPAKFDGKCNTCGSAFKVGMMVDWSPSRKVYGCPACNGQPGVVTPAQTPAQAIAAKPVVTFDAAARESLLASLDTEQAQVAAWTPDAGNLRVVAAAGSGKTTTVTALVGNLLTSGVVTPRDLVVTTFTRKAADELMERLARVVPANLLTGATVNTFHTIAGQALRAVDPHRWPTDRNVDGTKRAKDCYGKDILWERALDCEVVRPLNVHGIGAPQDAWSDYRMAVEVIRANGLRIGTDEARAACAETGLPDLYTAWDLYEQQKRQQESYDFADQLAAFYDYARRQAGGRVVIVDEAQDNSKLQIAIALALAGETGRLILVGDVRQSIYEWRGGAPELFLNADKAMDARTLYMTRNYRSGASIIAMGNRIAKGRTWSLGPASKVGVAARQGEGKITVKGYADASDAALSVTSGIKGALEDGVMTPADFAILCRTRAQQATYEAELLAAGVPVAIVGGSSFFTSKAWRDYAAVLAVVTGDADGDALQRAVRREQGCGYWAGVACANALRSAGDTIAAMDAAAPGIRTARARTALQGFARWARDTRALTTFADVCNRVAERLMAETTEGDGRTDEDNRSAYEVAARLAAARGSTRAALDFAAECAKTAVDADKAEGAGRVTISTMHKAKGREWPVVFVDATAGVFPHARCEGNERRTEEEARLFYVATTRAKRELNLTWCAAHNNRAAGCSDFIRAFAPVDPTPVPPATEPVPVTEEVTTPATESAPEAAMGADRTMCATCGTFAALDNLSVGAGECADCAGEIVEEIGSVAATAPTAAALRAALTAYAPVAEKLTAAAPAPEAGQRYVQIALSDFDALLAAHGFQLDPQVEGRTGQRVLTVTLANGSTVAVYTSIPAGERWARELGEDSIRVVPLTAAGRPAMKRQPYAARTVNWRRTLLSRIDTALAALE